MQSVSATQDAIIDLIAAQLYAKGLSHLTAFELAEELESEYRRLILDEATQCWVLIACNGAEPAGTISYHVIHEVELVEASAAKASACSAITLINLRPMLRNALEDILSHERGKAQSHKGRSPVLKGGQVVESARPR